MEQLEIISVRTSGPCELEARKYMKEFCRVAEKNKVLNIKFYTHATIPGDLALVITSKISKSNMAGTDLGTYISQVLRQFGLVDYNCWRMFDNQVSPSPPITS